MQNCSIEMIVPAVIWIVFIHFLDTKRSFIDVGEWISQLRLVVLLDFLVE